MIDEETRQIEHACHPRDNGDDMDRLRPGIEVFRIEPEDKRRQRKEHR
jgi:hypothetical protein